MKIAPTRTTDQSALGNLHFNNNSALMSSLGIAELTGKRHDNVVRDIRTMLKSLNLGLLSFEDTYLDCWRRSNIDHRVGRLKILTRPSDEKGSDLRRRSNI